MSRCRYSFDKELLTIKDFSEFAGMTPSSLRHYDSVGVFSPASRGVDAQNNYRLYSPLQITTVKMIRVLSQIGVPLKTIKALADVRTPERVVKLLDAHKNRIKRKIGFLKEVNAVIDTFIELLNEAMDVDETELSVIEMPEKQLILGNATDYHGTTGFIREFTRFCNDSHQPKLNMSFPVGGYFENMSAFLKEPARPNRFFALDPKGYQRKAAGLYLVGYTRGYYGRTNDLPKRMASYAQEYGLAFSGPVYNLYLSDELSRADPEQYLLQASASVKATWRISDRRDHQY